MPNNQAESFDMGNNNIDESNIIDASPPSRTRGVLSGNIKKQLNRGMLNKTEYYSDGAPPYY